MMAQRGGEAEAVMGVQCEVGEAPALGAQSGVEVAAMGRQFWVEAMLKS